MLNRHPSRRISVASTERVGNSRRTMNSVLPTPLLFAGVVALWPLAAVVRWPTSPPRLFAEAFGTTFAVIGLVQLTWIALWVLEKRW
jgi:hypothetical protein